MSNRKKIVIMSGLVLLLAVTAIFNFILAGYDNKSANAQKAVTTATYFSNFRNERTTTRNEEIVQLDSVIKLYNAGDEKYENATSMKLTLVKTMEKELALETNIKSLGFTDTVVRLSSDSNNVTVYINSNELSMDTALKIYNILKNETGIVKDQIYIFPVYSES